MTFVPKKVMIIEDEPDAAELFAEMMRLNGFRVIKTYSSTPAMSIIREEKPDLILLDIMMPEISGIEILHLMRSDPVLALIPVVVVSARATPTDVQTGLDAGASIYLTKPVGYMDLKNAVDRLLQGT
jgi:two-component system alkaline phosphatase synthesis response regulator PhoP